MSIPLWYQVYTKTLSFKEFLDRFNDRKFQEREVLPIFVLAVLYNHDPYIKGSHILNYFMHDGDITERSMKYFYLYWAIGKGFSNDLRLAGNQIGGDFRSIKIKMHDNFTSDYLNDWIGILLRAFFGVSVYLNIPEIKSDLRKALEYTKKIEDSCFECFGKTTEKMFKLAIAHDNLNEIIRVFKFGIYPDVLKPYRKNLSTFKNIVSLFSPYVLKSCGPFTDLELGVINVEHTNLYESGDIDFFLYYAEEFTRIFGKEHIITKQIQKYLEPSQENDQIKANQFLRKLNPLERIEYIPQKFGVTDNQLSRFIGHIKREGIVPALMPYITNNKRLLEIQFGGSELANDIITSTQCSIYLYSPDDLIFYNDEDDKVYVFLPEELLKFDKRENPYNRKPLPDYLYEDIYEEYDKTENLEEIWTRILRHPVSFNL